MIKNIVADANIFLVEPFSCPPFLSWACYSHFLGNRYEPFEHRFCTIFIQFWGIITDSQASAILRGECSTLTSPRRSEISPKLLLNATILAISYLACSQVSAKNVFSVWFVHSFGRRYWFSGTCYSLLSLFLGTCYSLLSLFSGICYLLFSIFSGIR